MVGWYSPFHIRSLISFIMANKLTLPVGLLLRSQASPDLFDYWKTEATKVTKARQHLNERHQREIDWERTHDETEKVGNMHRVAGVEFGERWITINRQCVKEGCEERRKCVESVRTAARERRGREEQVQRLREELVSRHLFGKLIW